MDTFFCFVIIGILGLSLAFVGSHSHFLSLSHSSLVVCASIILFISIGFCHKNIYSFFKHGIRSISKHNYQQKLTINQLRNYIKRPFPTGGYSDNYSNGNLKSQDKIIFQKNSNISITANQIDQQIDNFCDQINNVIDQCNQASMPIWTDINYNALQRINDVNIQQKIIVILFLRS